MLCPRHRAPCLKTNVPDLCNCFQDAVPLHDYKSVYRARGEKILHPYYVCYSFPFSSSITLKKLLFVFVLALRFKSRNKNQSNIVRLTKILTVDCSNIP